MGIALEDGSRVGVIGGGPAGSLFAQFLLSFAERMELDLSVDIYEPRDFTKPGPAGCNMCGGNRLRVPRPGSRHRRHHPAVWHRPARH